MSRSTRLPDLIQLLRTHRYPVSAGTLAVALEISPRTLYRDIATLQAMGAPVRGEAGVGYVLESGFLLPPLMFTLDELEALVLGADYVASRTDHALSAAAQNALTRIAAILPEPLKRGMESASLMTGPPGAVPVSHVDPAQLRQAIRREIILEITYRDRNARPTQRRIWPFAMAYFDNAHILVAWCELRACYRHFRLDRIDTVNMTGKRYPERRQGLLKIWHEQRIAEERPCGNEEAPDKN